LKVSEKTFLVLAITILTLIIVQLIIGQSMIAHFESVERKVMVEELQSVERAFEGSVEELSLVTRDWAQWDDTYNFMETGSEEYVKSNLVDATFKSLKVNMILYISVNGDIVWGKAYNLSAEREESLPETLLLHTKRDSPLFKKCLSEGGLDGIIMLERPAYISMQPILMSNGTGPPRGVLLMGRYIDQVQLDSIRMASGKNFTLNFVDEIGAVEGERVYDNIYIKPLNENILGRLVLKDVYGNDKIVFEVSEYRWIYREGVVHTFYFAFATISGTLLIGVGTFLLLKHIF